MTRLFLVRHGKPAAVWGDDDPDPGLDSTGHAQAAAAAQSLQARGPISIVTSPLQRTRETAAAFEELWGSNARVEPAVGEIPSPGDDVVDRRAWLIGVMRSNWRDLAGNLPAWRQGLLETLLACSEDHVVVTHFVAINVAIGAATDDERVMVASPDHCSITELEIVDGRLVLIARGSEAATAVR
jgi:broad specificity phosphatase PhoE